MSLKIQVGDIVKLSNGDIETIHAYDAECNEYGGECHYYNEDGSVIVESDDKVVEILHRTQYTPPPVVVEIKVGQIWHKEGENVDAVILSIDEDDSWLTYIKHDKNNTLCKRTVDCDYFKSLYTLKEDV